MMATHSNILTHFIRVPFLPISAAFGGWTKKNKNKWIKILPLFFLNLGFYSLINRSNTSLATITYTL